MFKRKELKNIKSIKKRLEFIDFKPLPKRNTLPAPLNKICGSKIKASDLTEIGNNYKTFFLWKTADILEKRALYGHLFYSTQRGLIPIARLDYHCSHKGLHIILNCEDERDLIGRALPGCKEFNLNLNKIIDPDNKVDRQRFISIFCEKLNITLGREDMVK